MTISREDVWRVAVRQQVQAAEVEMLDQARLLFQLPDFKLPARSRMQGLVGALSPGPGKGTPTLRLAALAQFLAGQLERTGKQEEPFWQGLRQQIGKDEDNLTQDAAIIVTDAADATHQQLSNADKAQHQEAVLVALLERYLDAVLAAYEEVELRQEEA
jgi:hypothetical protein